MGGTGKLSGLPVGQSGASSVEDAATQFAHHVRQTLRGPILTYSQRQALVNYAHRRGITRFEANLIIAAVLHRSGVQQEFEPADSPRRAWALPALTFVVVQGVILAGAWWLLR